MTKRSEPVRRGADPIAHSYVDAQKHMNSDKYLISPDGGSVWITSLWAATFPRLGAGGLHSNVGDKALCGWVGLGVAPPVDNEIPDNT